MRVHVVFFAGLAVKLGRRNEDLDLPGTPTAGDLYAHYAARVPELGAWGQALLVAVNAEFCGPSTPLGEGDEVALLPPMSGGGGAGDAPGSAAGPLIEVRLLRCPLPPLEAWSGGRYGAVVSFDGVVRNHTPAAPDRTVVGLEYEAYERMAERQMAALAQQAAARWPLTHIHMAHRLGALTVGEVSVRIAVAAPHRADAFAACRFLIDTLKRSVPIWKKEHFTDGSAWADGEFPEDQRFSFTAHRG